MKVNKYKIIEDRPDLTSEQVVAGMSFGMVQKKIPASKSVSLNTLIAAGISAVVIISVIFIYRSFSAKPNIKKEQLLMNDTIIENKTNINSDAVVLRKEIPVTNNKQIIDATFRDKKEKVDKINGAAFTFYKPKRCVILLPSYCCYCIPKTSDPKFATSVDSAGIEFEFTDCQSLDQKNVSCIWLTLTTTENSYLKLEDQLKNFSLLNAKNKEIHPFLVKVTSDPKLWKSDFKGQSVIVHYTKQIDVLLFFKNADPKVGSKIRINKFVATIKTTDALNLK